MAEIKTNNVFQDLIASIVDMAFTISDGSNSQVVTDGDTVTFVSGAGVTVSVSGLNVTVQNDRGASAGVRLDGNDYKLEDGSTPIGENVSLIGTSGFDIVTLGFDNALWRGENETRVESPNLVQIDGSNGVSIRSNTEAEILAPVLKLDTGLTADPPTVTVGSGSPNGVVTADPGSLFLNKLGGAGNTLWVKESGSGNTGWVAK